MAAMQKQLTHDGSDDDDTGSDLDADDDVDDNGRAIGRHLLAR